MISAITLQNSYSYENTTISFQRGRIQYKEHYICPNGLVNPIAIYGVNGSGKSVFFASLLVLWRYLVDDPDNAYFIPNIVFEHKRTSLSISVLLSGATYTYEVSGSFLRGEPIQEKLTKGGEVYFIREGNKYTLLGKEITDEVPTNYLLLRKIGIESYNVGDRRNEIHDVYDFFKNMCFISADGKIFAKAAREVGVEQLVINNCGKVLSFQQKYRSPFPRYIVEKDTNANGEVSYSYKRDIHGHSFSFPPQLISSGVKSQYRALSVILSLPKGSTVFIDEIDNSLHTLVLKDFVHEICAQGYQLIFSTHDTNLLEDLRPDQVYFASWKDGVSSLKRLSAMYPAIREINNIESMYLRGVFDEKINE